MYDRLRLFFFFFFTSDTMYICLLLQDYGLLPDIYTVYIDLYRV